MNQKMPYILILFVALSLACQKSSTKPENQPPVITNLVAHPESLDWGEVSQLIVEATDDDGDSIAFTWHFDFGTILSGIHSDTIYWQAPDSTGEFIGNVTVTDRQQIATSSIVLQVNDHPSLSVKPDTLTFSERINQQMVTIFNTGTGNLDWTVTRKSDWITLDHESGSVEDSVQITVNVNRSGFTQEDAIVGEIVFSSSVGEAHLVVMMQMPVPDLNISPTELDFGETDQSSFFIIQNSGTGELTWELTKHAEWLHLSTVSGSTIDESDRIDVTVDRTGLIGQLYTDDIVIRSNGGQDTVHVQMQVVAPILAIDPPSLNFGDDTITLQLTVKNQGNGILQWTALKNRSWIQLEPVSGTVSDDSVRIDVTVDRTGLEAGDYSGMIAFNSNGGYEEVSVTMEILPVIPGQWLVYDDDHFESQGTVGAKGWMWMRFTRPDDWAAVRVTQVRLNMLAGSYTFDIDGFNESHYNNGQYYPTESYTNLVSGLTQEAGWQIYTVESYIFTKREFFIAVYCYQEQGPYLKIDTSDSLANRCGVMALAQNTPLIGATFGIQVYVEPQTSDEAIKSSKALEGRWLNATDDEKKINLVQ